VRTVSLIRIIAALIATLSLAPAANAAGDPPVFLSWAAPSRADCPDAAYVLGEIERYVGSASARPDGQIHAKATVRGVGPDRWQLLLETTEGGVAGERVFQDESCRAVADAAVVVLAWMIDPDAMANRSSPALEKVIPTRASPPSPAPTTTSLGSPLRPFVRLGLVGDWGTLPWPALGAELRGGAAWRRLRLAGHAGYWPSRSKAAGGLSDGASAGARFSLATFGLGGCLDVIPDTVDRPLQFSLCAGPEVDWIRGVGFGVTDPARGSKAWLALNGGVEARWLLHGPLRLVFGARAVLPTEREHFALQGVGEIYRPTIVAGRVGFGLELEL
jgi:hypothetical protein